MKKKMIILLAAAMMTIASAGSALAAFGDFELIRIAFGNTNEVATDLGSVTSLMSTTNNALSTGTSNFVSMGAGSTGAGSKVYTAYFATESVSGNNALYFSGASAAIGTTIAVNTDNAWNAAGALSVIGQVSKYYAQAAVAKTTDSINSSVVSAQGLITNPWSYSANFEGGQPGSSNLSGTSNSPTDASLTALATQGLYYWDGISSTATEVAIIQTNLDGSTTINPTATPIPAAAYLLGSGLMGLFGLRRKQRA